MTFKQLIQIIWARRWLAVAILVAALVSTFAVNLFLPKVYVATSSLVINQRGADPVTGNYNQTESSADYLATQVDVIGSHNVAVKVVDKLRLTDFPVVRKQYLEATGGAGSIRDWLADSLLNDLEVTPSRESSVISISYANEDPRFAAQMTNAFADAYIQTNLELQIEPAKRQAMWYQDQVIQLRKTLEASQQKLSAYQQQQGLVGNENRLDVETTRLTELNSQLVIAQGNLADTQSRLKQLNEASVTGKLEQLPDIINNNLLQSMKADLARAEGKLAESAERYGTGHPTYIASLAEVNSLRARLQTEMGTATGSVRQGAEIAQQRVYELQASVDKQKARILQLKQGNDAQTVLSQDVDNAQRAYDNAQLRSSQVRLQSQVDQSSIAVLNPAITPDRAARPRILRNLALAFVLGSLVALATALGLELSDRRVRTDIDITDLAGLPLLARVPYVIR